jgi:hypothetical protein
MGDSILGSNVNNNQKSSLVKKTFKNQVNTLPVSVSQLESL